MTEETDRAIEAGLYLFGERALKILPDMFESGFHFPVDEDDERRFLETLDLKAIETFSRSITEYAAEHRGKAGKNNLKLALRIPSHDLNNLAGLVIPISNDFKNLGRLELPRGFFSSYTSYRALVLAMADLGLGGAFHFGTKMPVSELGDILFRDPNYFRVTASDLKTINSREYVSLYQLVKNVPKSVGRKKVSLEIEVAGQKEGNLIVVRDDGQGILDQEGNPISAERLPEIFGDYSSREGGGLGLQLVKALVELPPSHGKRTEKGYVSVSTKSEGGAPLSYNTGEGSSKTLEKDLVSGTEFTLYFRHTRGQN